MTIPEFIEKAIEGGWLIPDNKYSSFHGEYPRDSALEIEVTEYQDTTMIKFWHKKIDFGGGVYTSIPFTQMLLDPLAWQAVGKSEGWNGPEFFSGKYKRKMMGMVVWLLEEQGTIEQYLETL